MGEAALKITTPKKQAQRFETPPPGWINGTQLLAIMTAEDCEQQMQRFARSLARSADPLLNSRVCKVAGVWFFDPRAEFEGVAIGTALAATRSREVDSFPMPAEARADFALWPTKDQKRFFAGWKTLRAWDEICREFSGRSMQQRIEMLHDRIGDALREAKLPLPSERLLRDWKNHQLNPRSARWTGLRDRRGRRSEGGGYTEFYDIFKVYYLDKRQPGVRLAYDRAAAVAESRGVETPAYRTTLKYVQKELPDSVSSYYRRGPRYWESNCEPYIERDPTEYRPNEVIVGDCKVSNVIVTERGKARRCTIAAFMDQRSRLITGWSISTTEHSDVIAAAFANSCKIYGVPDRVYIDNGKAYKKLAKREAAEDQFASMIGDLCDVTFARPYNAKAKGCIERWFQTVSERFEKMVPSYIGDKPENRPENFYRDLRKGGIDVPSLDWFREAFAGHVELYNHAIHSAADMNGRAPMVVFLDENPIPKRTAPEEILAAALQRVETVKVTRNGVRIHGVNYDNDKAKLFPLRGRTVQVRINPSDMSKVTVFDKSGFICEAFNVGLAGTNVEDIRAGNRRKKAARKLVQRARPAHREALSSVEQLAAKERDQRAAAKQPLRKAVGDGTPHRPLQIISGAAEIEQSLAPNHQSDAAWADGEKNEFIDWLAQRQPTDDDEIPIVTMDDFDLCTDETDIRRESILDMLISMDDGAPDSEEAPDVA